MKRTTLLGTCVAAALAAATNADPPTENERLFRLASTRLEQGEHEMSRARAFTTDSAKLQAYDRAIARLRQARTAAWSGHDATFDALREYSYHDLVRAYDAQAEIYFARKSLSLARERNIQALSLDPTDARALNLDVMIRAAEAADIYDVDQGAQAVNRIRDRRAAAGLPLRDRGVSTRR
jgi:Tfp pilus assembly protein PilF